LKSVLVNYVDKSAESNTENESLTAQSPIAPCACALKYAEVNTIDCIQNNQEVSNREIRMQRISITETWKSGHRTIPTVRHEHNRWKPTTNIVGTTGIQTAGNANF